MLDFFFAERCGQPWPGASPDIGWGDWLGATSFIFGPAPTMEKTPLCESDRRLRPSHYSVG
jgi:hypothetical protein